MRGLLTRRLTISTLIMSIMVAALLHGQCLAACSVRFVATAGMRAAEHPCCPPGAGEERQSQQTHCVPGAATLDQARAENIYSADAVALPLTVLHFRAELNRAHRLLPDTSSGSKLPTLVRRLSILRI
jgi:hypothetical protein